MTDWLNSWKDFERICSVSGITPEEMEKRGKRFLTYHKMLCCTPEYILPPEPAGSAIEKKERFLKRIEEHGYAPTERELCNKAGVSSRAALHRHLVRMKFEGLIDYIPQKSRTIRILREAN